MPCCDCTALGKSFLAGGGAGPPTEAFVILHTATEPLLKGSRRESLSLSSCAAASQRFWSWELRPLASLRDSARFKVERVEFARCLESSAVVSVRWCRVELAVGGMRLLQRRSKCFYFFMQNNSSRFFTHYNVDKEFEHFVHVSIVEFNEKKRLAPKANMGGGESMFLAKMSCGTSSD